MVSSFAGKGREKGEDEQNYVTLLSTFNQWNQLKIFQI